MGEEADRAVVVTAVRRSCEPAIGVVDEVVVDCSSPAELMTFWAGVLGGRPVERSAGLASVDPKCVEVPLSET